jgi:hypothetical protein
MSAVKKAAPDVPAPVGILFNLPDHLQTIEVLRALICAEEAGYQRRAREPAAAALSQLRLSTSRP